MLSREEIKLEIIKYGKFLNREAGKISLGVVKCFTQRCKLQLSDRCTIVVQPISEYYGMNA